MSIVSQFTLLAKTKKGTKPDFHGAANPEEASRLYHYFVQKVKDLYLADRVKDGKFQAMMEVALVNDGPVSHFASGLFDHAKMMLISYWSALHRLLWSSRLVLPCLDGRGWMMRMMRIQCDIEQIELVELIYRNSHRCILQPSRAPICFIPGNHFADGT